MAILFDKEISAEKLLFAFNNNIVRFYSNSVLPVQNCEIEIVTDEAVPRIVTLNLYPSPNGKFYFNFKEIILSLMNLDKFKDDFETFNAAAIGYGNWDKLILITNISFKINFQNATFEELNITDLRFISSYQNFDSKIEIAKTKAVFLHFSNLKYWKGYPFDFTLYTDISNQTNELKETSLNYVFTQLIQSTSSQRLRLSNGLVQETFLNNEQKFFYFEFKNSTQLISSLTIEKINPDCENKHYLKWINPLGGWNYFLLKKGRINLPTKGIGEINNDFENIEDTISQTENIGVTSQKNIFVYEDCNENDIILMSELLESPKIYLFTGKPNTATTYKDWIEVTIKEKSNKIQDPKQNFVRVDLEIEMPKRITRTL